MLKKLKPEFLRKIPGLYKSDIKEVHKAYIELKTISQDMDLSTFEQDFYPYIKHHHLYMIEPLQSSPFDFSQKNGYKHEESRNFKHVSKLLKEMDEDQMFFDRSYLGLINMLRAIKATVNTQNPYLFD